MSSPTTPNELPSLAFGFPKHLLKWTHVPRLVPFRKSHSCGPWSRPILGNFSWSEREDVWGSETKNTCSPPIYEWYNSRGKRKLISTLKINKKQTGFQQEWQMRARSTLLTDAQNESKKCLRKAGTHIVLKDWLLSHCQMHMFLPSLLWLLICLGTSKLGCLFSNLNLFYLQSWRVSCVCWKFPPKLQVENRPANSWTLNHMSYVYIYIHIQMPGSKLLILNMVIRFFHDGKTY